MQTMETLVRTPSPPTHTHTHTLSNPHSPRKRKEQAKKKIIHHYNILLNAVESHFSGGENLNNY